MRNSASERLNARNFCICLYFSFYKQLKFRVQLSWVEHGKKCIPSGPDCFSLLIFFLLCCYKYSVSLHRSTVGWSVVDNRDIF